MSSMEIRFVSSNKHKIREVQEIFSGKDISVIPAHIKIDEIQVQDSEALVRHKVLGAFAEIGRPVFVEHTGLYISSFSDLPGGLTQVFWDALQADKFTEHFGQGSDTSVIAKTIIGYIDGKKFHHFSGEVRGNIARKPMGDRAFQWDCVFIPEGCSLTFAEMGPGKNDISMRRRALDQFSRHLVATR